LAQSLAGQQSQNLQRSSADIGRQERQNQVAERQQAGNLQLYEAKGELMSRQAEQEKVETMFGMAQNDLANKTQAYEAGKSKILKGVGGLASGVLGGFTSGALGDGTNFGQFMQKMG